MSVEINEKQNQLEIDLPENLTMANSQDFCDQFQDIANSNQLTLRATKLQQIDFCGVQTLLFLKKKYAKKLQITGHSPALIEAFSILGLIGTFGDKIYVGPEGRHKYKIKYGLKSRSL